MINNTADTNFSKSFMINEWNLSFLSELTNQINKRPDRKSDWIWWNIFIEIVRRPLREGKRESDVCVRKRVWVCVCCVRESVCVLKWKIKKVLFSFSGTFYSFQSSATRGQFHHHFMSSFYNSRLTMPLLAYGIEQNA